MARCRNICETLRLPINGYAASGIKRCTICAVYMDVKDIFCPCCGNKLRTKPRSKVLKDKKGKTHSFDIRHICNNEMK